MRVRIAGLLAAGMACVLASAKLALGAWKTTGPLAPPAEFAAAVAAGGQVVLSGGWADRESTHASKQVFAWDRRTNAWVSAPPLLEARAEHQLLAFPDGRLLAIGGRDGKRPVASAELWRIGDPAWRGAGAIAFPRRNSVATLLPDGRVLTLGGEPDGAESCPAEVWDPRALGWSVVSEIPGWCGQRAARLGNARIAISGGWDRGQARRGVGVWDPLAHTFTAASPLLAPRAMHSAITLRDGGVLVIGGYGVRWVDSPGLEALDAAGKRWILSPVATSLWRHQSAVVLPNGEVLMVDRLGVVWRWLPRENKLLRLERPPLGGGLPLVLSDGSLMLIGSAGRAQVFSESQPLVGRWLSFSHPQGLAIDFSLLPLPDGSVIFAGGDPVSGSSGAEQLDSASSRWDLLGAPLQRRSGQSAAVLADGRVLLAGGFDRSRFESPRTSPSTPYRPAGISKVMLKSAEVWGAASGWKATAELRESRADAPALTLPDGRVLVFGGYQHTYGPSFLHPPWLLAGPSRVLASVEAWSPRSARWSPAAAMLEPRMQHSASLLKDGRVLVVGGTPSADRSARPKILAELWEPRSNRWLRAGSPRQPRRDHAAVVLSDGRVLVAGGQLPVPLGEPETQGILDSAEIWDPGSNTWGDVRPMNAPRRHFAMALLPDGRVLVAGGTPGSNVAPEVWDPATDSWSFTGVLPHASEGSERLALLRDGRLLLVDKSWAAVWTPN